MTGNDSRYEVEIGEQKISISELSRKLTSEQFAEMIGDRLNAYANAFKNGKEIGKACHQQHPTIQRLIVQFAIGLIGGISQQDYTDARNEYAIATAKKIAAMYENGELNLGPFV